MSDDELSLDDYPEDSTGVLDLETPITPEEIPDEELAPYVFEDTYEENSKSTKKITEDVVKYDLPVIEERIQLLSQEMIVVRNKIKTYEDINKDYFSGKGEIAQLEDTASNLTESYDISTIINKIKDIENEILYVETKIFNLVKKLNSEEDGIIEQINDVEYSYDLEYMDNIIRELEGEVIDVKSKIQDREDMLAKILSGADEYTVDDVLGEIL